MQRTLSSILQTALVLGTLGSLAACGGDDDDTKPSIDGGLDGSVVDGGTPGDGGVSADGSTIVPAPTEFAVGTLVLGATAQETSGYFAFTPKAEASGAAVDLKTSRELPGQADSWVIGNSVYVSSGDGPRITRWVRDSTTVIAEAPAPNTVDFGQYITKSTPFWTHVFISATKAYVANGANQLVVWNPTTMAIEGTIDIPGIADKGANIATASFADRSNILVGDKLYRVIYYTNQESTHAPSSTVVVIDTAKNAYVTSIDVPCGGLDFGTKVDDSTLVFSNWTFSVGAALVTPGEPATCFAQIDTTNNTVASTTKFSDVTQGYEGAALRYLGNGVFGFSRFDLAKSDPQLVGKTAQEAVGLAQFTFYSYNLATHALAPIEGIEKNSGAVYEGRVKGQQWALVPAADYKSSTAYRIVDGKGVKGFTINGWLLRLFGYPN